MKKKIASLLVLFLLLPAVARAGAKLPFSFADTTPVGSWQTVKERTTDHKGKETVSVTKSSLVGTEERGGETYYWVEMETTRYKVKKGAEKQDGDRTILKVLIAASALEGDLANILNNPRGFADDIIIQNGNEDPMRLTGAGFMAQAAMQGLGLEIKYDFESQGVEKIDVPAGTFSCEKVAGTGSAEGRVLIKKVKVDSRSTTWISKAMPFGVVKRESNDLVNGKEQHIEAEVIDYGMEGAVSQITKTPKELSFGG